MGLYKRGDVWWFSYTYEGRRYFEAGDTDKRVAQSKLAERRRNGPEHDSMRITFREYATRWLERRAAAGVKSHDHDVYRVKRFALPRLGDKPLDAVTRTDVRDVVNDASATLGARTNEPLSPRTVLHVYTAIRTLYADAVAEGLVAASPCTLRTRRGELPMKRDRDPSWRAHAVYTRDETEQLVASEAIPADRRVLYALMLLGGMRFGEAAGRRWRDLDVDARPLGRMLVSTQADGDDPHADRETKTRTVREVPVHATLARILDAWRRSGFATMYGRHPEPDDWIVPHRTDVRKHRSERALERLKEDLDRLQLRSTGRARHAMRATFISLAITDGARADVLERVTHSGLRGGAFAGYVRLPWEAVCAEVAKLRIEGRVAQVIALPVAVGARASRVDRDSRRDSRRNRAISLALRLPGEGVEPSCAFRHEGF